MKKYYAAIDLKSFYASVECVERSLNTLTTDLVVADATRTDKTICLAVSPHLKAKTGLNGRCRLFEAKKTGTNFIIAPPRMGLYIEYSKKIFRDIYKNFVAPEDIFVYSIDEVFLDISSYLNFPKTTPENFIRKILKAIYEKTGLTATAGIGTNLYLAKIAMDILAKHADADETGSRMAFLDERLYKQKLWSHRPLTDFWRVGKGTAKRLERFNIFTQGDIARTALSDEEFLYKIFGTDTEIIIDHAFGIEPITLKEIKQYHSDKKSISEGQVIGVATNLETAKLLTLEMSDNLSLRLNKRKMKTNLLDLVFVFDKKSQLRSVHTSLRLDTYKAQPKIILAAASKLVDKLEKLLRDNTSPEQSFRVKKIYLSFNNLIPLSENASNQLNLFSNEIIDTSLSDAILDIKSRYGKNSILRGINLEKNATAKNRNKLIGGHHS